MTFCHNEGKFFLIYKGSPKVLKSDYHVQKYFLSKIKIIWNYEVIFRWWCKLKNQKFLFKVLALDVLIDWLQCIDVVIILISNPTITYLKNEYCRQFYRLLKKLKLWSPIKHSNMITLYSSSYGLKYQMGQVWSYDRDSLVVSLDK